MVGVEDLEQEVLALLGRGLGHPAVLEGELDALHLAALIDARVVVADPAVDRVLDRAGEDLAIGEVAQALAVLEDAPVDAHGQVDIGALDVDALAAVEKVDVHLLTHAHFLPARDRVGVVEHAGGEDKLGEIGQAHVGVHGVGVGGEEGDAPVVGALGAALHALVERGAERGLDQLHLVGIGIGETAGVGLSPDPDIGVELAFLDREGFDGAGVLERPLAAMLEEDLLRAGDIGPHEGIAAGLEHFLVEFEHERRGGGLRPDVDHLAGLDGDRIVDDDLGHLLESRVIHGAGMVALWGWLAEHGWTGWTG